MQPARPQQPTDWDELLEIFKHGVRANPRNVEHAITDKIGQGWEPAPLEDMLGSSPLLDYIRQGLPQRIEDTGLAEHLPERTPQWVRRIPLGGYSAERQMTMRELRAENPALVDSTILRGVGPTATDSLASQSFGDRFRPNAAQAAGAAVSDLVGVQGLQNIWWFLNAPQALASLATLQAVHGAGNEFKGTSVAPLLKSRTMRMAATAPAWIGMSMGIGAFGRQAGYGAAVPSEADRTQTADPLAEVASRFILGRTGQLMPYDDFVKERPDVSRGEYEAYKAFLHGNKLPIKATLDGIHGPEVNFLGKSMPVLTAIAPMVAGALGARYGVRKAAARLASDPSGNLMEQRDAMLSQWKKSKAAEAGGSDSFGRLDGDAAISVEDYRPYKEVNDMIQDETLTQALLHGGGAMGATAIAGATLESLRRALRGHAPAEPDELSSPEVYQP